MRQNLTSMLQSPNWPIHRRVCQAIEDIYCLFLTELAKTQITSHIYLVVDLILSMLYKLTTNLMSFKATPQPLTNSATKFYNKTCVTGRLISDKVTNSNHLKYAKENERNDVLIEPSCYLLNCKSSLLKNQGRVLKTSKGLLYCSKPYSIDVFK